MNVYRKRMAKKKGNKGPGDRIHIRLKQDEPDYIIDWINTQSEISLSLRRLIAKEVSENGIRDLCDPLYSTRLQRVSNEQIFQPVQFPQKDDRLDVLKPDNELDHDIQTEQINKVPDLISNTETDVQLDNNKNVGPLTEQKKPKKKPRRNYDLTNW